MVTAMMSRNWRDLIRPKAIQLDPNNQLAKNNLALVKQKMAK